MPASYFDVDGTLVGTNLVHPTLFYLLNQPTPWSTFRKVGRALLRAPEMALAELIDRRMFNELLFSSYEGTSEDRLVILADEAFEKVIRPSMFRSSIELIQKSRDAGHEIVLVSGALDVILRLVADHVGGATTIGNHLEIKDRICTGKILHPVIAGPEKARAIRRHARQNGHDLDECFAFSDSYSDVPMLSVVGHPAAVNPDRRLALLAKAYAWPTFHLEAS